MITQVITPGLAATVAHQAPARGAATGALSAPRPRADGRQRCGG